MKKEINDKNVEMLIHSGALDGFGLNHATMDQSKQIDQAGYELYVLDFTLQEKEEYSFAELAEQEKEALSLNLLYHPMRMYHDLIEKHQLVSLSDVIDGKIGRTLARIKKQKVIMTKQGKPMAFLELDDGVSTLEVTLFTDTYQKYRDRLDQDFMVFKLNINQFRGKISYVLDRLYDIKEL
jgi:DNA polymerase-3 subunit alpha